VSSTPRRELERGSSTPSTSLLDRMRVVERRDWWLWSGAVLITLVLTLAIISFVLPTLHTRWSEFNSAPVSDTVPGLVGLVLIFDIYTVYQHFQVQQVRKQMMMREELFRLITENAADMIAVVGVGGERLYNSPSYELSRRILHGSAAASSSSNSRGNGFLQDETT